MMKNKRWGIVLVTNTDLITSLINRVNSVVGIFKCISEILESQFLQKIKKYNLFGIERSDLINNCSQFKQDNLDIIFIARQPAKYVFEQFSKFTTASCSQLDGFIKLILALILNVVRNVLAVGFLKNTNVLINYLQFKIKLLYLINGIVKQVPIGYTRVTSITYEL